MANVKNITELPMAESAEGLNLIVNDGGAAKQIAASAVGAQADWNQNDPTKIDYVKNRPFFSNGMKEEYIYCLPEITLKDGNSSELYCEYEVWDMHLKFDKLQGSDITNNTVFIININGLEYKSKITYWEEGVSYFGLHHSEFTEEIPFFIEFLMDEKGFGPRSISYIFLHPSIHLPVNTISVYRDEKVEVEDIQRIDPKYLPVEAYDIDITCVLYNIDTNGDYYWDFTINHMNSYNNILEKITNGIKPKSKVMFVIDEEFCSNENDDALYNYIDISGREHWEYCKTDNYIYCDAQSYDFRLEISIYPDNSIDLYIQGGNS